MVECDLGRLGPGDEVEIDLAAGRVAVPSRDIVRKVAPLPEAMQRLLAAGGLIPFLKQHPDRI